MAEHRITRWRRHYNDLRKGHFNHYEARWLARLSGDDPALKQMVKEREARWERFMKRAILRISRGVWQDYELESKWRANLLRFYRKNGWLVTHGATGGQDRMAKGMPNPLAYYRARERVAPDKGYVSPWELRIARRKPTSLSRGLIAAQRAGRELAVGTISKDMVRSWIAQKDEAISGARGTRRTRLTIERNRLDRLL